MNRLKVFSILFAIFGGLLACAQTSTDTSNLCEGLVTHKNPVVIPRLDKPEPLSSFIEPTFGSSITRVSSSSFGKVVKPMYNTIQAWNADESLLMLYHTGEGGAGHHLYDGKTYNYLRALDIVPRDIEQVYWHSSDPNVFYYLSRKSPNYGKFIRYNVALDQKDVLRDFNGLCPDESIATGGNDPQMMSWDSDLLGLRCPSEPAKTFFYRISDDSLSESVAMGEGTAYAPYYAMTPAASGERLFLQGDVLSAKDLSVERSLDVTRYNTGEFKPEHAVLGQLHNGGDAYYSVIYNAPQNGCDGDASEGIGALTSYDLETGACRVLVGESNGYGYPHSGVHPSALSSEYAGWVAVSSIAYGQFEYFENGQEAPVLVSEIILASSDPQDPQVCRLAHARTFAKSAEQGGYAGYFGEPHPVISPSGTRILFGSDWYDSGSVDTYVIELPAYKP